MSKKDQTPELQDLDESVVNDEQMEENKKKDKKSGKKGSKKDLEKDRIVELEQNVGEAKDKYLRLYAEFENYKKRTIRERLELMGTAAQDTLSALLPILDDFDRAQKAAEEGNSEPFSEGVILIYNKLKSTLEQRGLKPMETTGEIFDPELHEAITEIPAPNDEMKGKIIDTIEKGYFLKDKIIRYAKVVVGK